MPLFRKPFELKGVDDPLGDRYLMIIDAVKNEPIVDLILMDIAPPATRMGFKQFQGHTQYSWSKPAGVKI